MPGTFSEMRRCLPGLAMKGLNNSVFELVSDHLGEDQEWAWVKDFQKQTGLTVTLIATTAPAYENNKMYNLAEQARLEGMEVRPQAATVWGSTWLTIELPRICWTPDLAK